MTPFNAPYKSPPIAAIAGRLSLAENCGAAGALGVATPEVVVTGDVGVVGAAGLEAVAAGPIDLVNEFVAGGGGIVGLVAGAGGEAGFTPGVAWLKLLDIPEL